MTLEKQVESGSLGASRAMQLGFDSKDSGESTLGLPVRLLRFAFGPPCVPHSAAFYSE